MIGLLGGCAAGWVPFQNEPPRLLSVNDRTYEPRGTLLERLPPYEDGEAYPLDLEVTDPEGDRVQIWFPEAPGFVDFPPDGRSGLLWVPEGTIGTLTVWVVLEDPDDPEVQAVFDIRLAGVPPNWEDYASP